MTLAGDVIAAPGRVEPGPRSRLAGLALSAWVLLVATTLAVGAVWHPGYPAGWFPPFHAHWRVLTYSLLPAVAYGALGLWLLPILSKKLAWRWLLGVAVAVGIGWSYVLAVSAGTGVITRPFRRAEEYLAVLPAVGDHPLTWLSSFVDGVPHFPTHVAGHPPLTVLIFWALAKVGLSGPGWASALCIVAGASASAALLIVVRVLGDEARARRAAPYLAIAPFALTIATSADALFLGVSAWGIAALAVSARRCSVPLGVLAGVLLGATAYLSYGLVVMGALVIGVLVLRWSPRVAIATVVGALTVAAAFTVGGFWWIDGVRATAVRWQAGTGSDRPYDFTVFGNVAVLAVIAGPACAAALGWVRDRATIVLAGAATVAVLALDVSGVTRGEVERIWLPFAPWLVLLCGALPARFTRWALAAQIVVAIAVQGTLALSW